MEGLLHMKRNTKIIVIIIAYLAAAAIALFLVWRMFIFSPATPSEDPAGSVELFIDAYNADDIEKMLRYLTADNQKKIRGVLDAADGVSNGKVRQAIELMPIASRFAKMMNKDDTLPDIDVAVKNVKKHKKKATVDITATAKATDLISVGFVVNMEYDGDSKVWLIDSAIPDT